MLNATADLPHPFGSIVHTSIRPDNNPKETIVTLTMGTLMNNQTAFLQHSSRFESITFGGGGILGQVSEIVDINNEIAFVMS